MEALTVNFPGCIQGEALAYIALKCIRVTVCSVQCTKIRLLLTFPDQVYQRIRKSAEHLTSVSDVVVRSVLLCFEKTRLQIIKCEESPKKKCQMSWNFNCHFRCEYRNISTVSPVLRRKFEQDFNRKLLANVSSLTPFHLQPVGVLHIGVMNMIHASLELIRIFSC